MSSVSATITKKLSTRVDDATLAELQHIEASLSSSNWSDRVIGIRRLNELVVSQPTVVAGQINKVSISAANFYCLILCIYYIYLNVYAGVSVAL